MKKIILSILICLSIYFVGYSVSNINDFTLNIIIALLDLPYEA